MEDTGSGMAVAVVIDALWSRRSIVKSSVRCVTTVKLLLHFGILTSDMTGDAIGVLMEGT